MKILIVDDNETSRMMLRLLLEDYAEKNNTSFYINECENGLEAVHKAKIEKIDLIFIDIMMPEMSGIEATKKIRRVNKEVMIIAISAVDDNARQKEILRNGAEDYIPKPLDAEILSSRLENYIPLLKLRHHGNLSLHRKASNLYTKNIFRRQTIFYVTSEEALAEFWEYYLLRETPSKLDGLSDVVRAVFSIGEAIIKLKGEPWIIVEADNEATYFTVNQLNILGDLALKIIMKKNREVKDYKSTDEKISFRLSYNNGETTEAVNEEKISEVLVKEEKVQETTPQELQKTTDEAVQKTTVEEVTEPDINEVEIETTNTDEYQVFDYIESDDLVEIKECLGDLNSLMLMLGKSSIEPFEVTEIARYLEKLGRILSLYVEASKISAALINLSRDIYENIDRFIEISSDLSTLSAAFSSDLQSWYKMTFYDGAPSINFMDDTIVANTQIISSMLKEDESDASEADMDDIFDF